jgi:hypothetical protein
MQIDLYCFCYNESKIAPFILDYWAKFVTNAYVYDNGSTDGTQDILLAENRFNVELRHYDTGNTLNDGIITDLRNDIWKQSRGVADFVVVCDFDEALFCANIISTLQYMLDNNKTICAPIIYELTSEVLPAYTPDKLMHQNIGQGMLHMKYGKHILFNPNLVNEINYSPGAHVCRPTGVVNYYDNKDIYLFHCKRIDRELFAERFIMIKNRMSEINKHNGWGVQYTASLHEAMKEYDEMLNKSNKLPI